MKEYIKDEPKANRPRKIQEHIWRKDRIVKEIRGCGAKMDKE